MDNKISVVIATLDEEENIKNCLDGLLSQSSKPFEIIVVDNGSKDKTFSIVRGLKKEFKEKEINLKLFYYPYGNQTNARSFGVSKSKGEIIAYVDADAIPNNVWIAKIKKHLNNMSVVGIGGKSHFRNREKIFNFFYRANYYLRLIFSDFYYIGGGNSAFRKSTFISVKGYSGIEKLRKEKKILYPKDDYFLSKKLQQKGIVKFCSDMNVSLLYRIRGKKKTNNKISISEILHKALREVIYDYKISSYCKKNSKPVSSF